MRLTALTATALLLSACAGTQVGGLTSVQPMQPGTYILSEGGEVVEIVELMPSGRLQHLTYDRVVIDAGYWSEKGDTICFDLDGDGEGREEQCWRNSKPDADGIFVTSRIGGSERYSAKPVVKSELVHPLDAGEQMDMPAEAATRIEND
ncbi:MAG: hypothetical protein AAF687_13380 [Pseudomonadota bacterium]